METNGEAIRNDLAEGLVRWYEFAAVCQSLEGPAGVAHRGWSELRHARSAACAEWGSWSGDPIDSVLVFGGSYLEQATNHLLATSLLVRDARTSQSTSALIRAWSEASARSLWLLDPTLTPVDAVGRMLTEYLHELRYMGEQERERLQGRLSITVLTSLASEAGLDSKTNKKGKTIAFGEARPNTYDLLEKLNETSILSLDTQLLHRMYRAQSASVHSSLQAWFNTLLNTHSPGSTLGYLGHELLRAFDVHVRAVNAANAWRAWSPDGFIEQARDTCMAKFFWAWRQLDVELNRHETTQPPVVPARSA